MLAACAIPWSLVWCSTGRLQVLPLPQPARHLAQIRPLRPLPHLTAQCSHTQEDNAALEDACAAAKAGRACGWPACARPPLGPQGAKPPGACARARVLPTMILPRWVVNGEGRSYALHRSANTSRPCLQSLLTCYLCCHGPCPPPCPTYQYPAPLGTSPRSSTAPPPPSLLYVGHSVGRASYAAAQPLAEPATPRGLPAAAAVFGAPAGNRRPRQLAPGAACTYKLATSLSDHCLRSAPPCASRTHPSWGSDNIIKLNWSGPFCGPRIHARPHSAILPFCQ
jgi:hypothetical protein